MLIGKISKSFTSVKHIQNKTDVELKVLHFTRDGKDVQNLLVQVGMKGMKGWTHF